MKSKLFTQSDVDEAEAKVRAMAGRLEQLEEEFQARCAANGGSVDISARAEIRACRAELEALEARRDSMRMQADVDDVDMNDDYLDGGADDGFGRFGGF